MKQLATRRNVFLTVAILATSLLIEIGHYLFGQWIWLAIDVAGFVAGLILMFDWALDYRTRGYGLAGLVIAGLSAFLVIANYP